jgi:hypothetical protein
LASKSTLLNFLHFWSNISQNISNLLVLNTFRSQFWTPFFLYSHLDYFTILILISSLCQQLPHLYLQSSHLYKTPDSYIQLSISCFPTWLTNKHFQPNASNSYFSLNSILQWLAQAKILESFLIPVFHILHPSISKSCHLYLQAVQN